MEKIYEYMKDELFLQFSVNDIKKIIKSANKNGFLLIQDDYRSVPRKIMTSKGIIDIVLDYDSENEVVSKNTGDVCIIVIVLVMIILEKSYLKQSMKIY